MPAPDRTSISGALDVKYNDTQVRVTGATVETYGAFRIRILRAEALAIGNINLAWNPSTSDITVHRVLIHRGAETIDVLKTAKFSVFQREGRLEQAMLDGLLTASLQVPGLRIGDELEFASTSRTSKQPFTGQVFGAFALPGQLPPGRYRLDLTWSQVALKTKAAPALAPTLVEAPGRVTATLTDPPQLSAPASSPARYAIGRVMEYSTFARWQDVSRVEYNLFSAASQIPEDAALKAKISGIAAGPGGPLDRARAALSLVQDDIRYVYAGMDGGDYHPATVAQTWERRFGDCKGKTAMLLGVLRQLGIPAEAVLVSLAGGDGIDERLPSPAPFDHVVVRATIGGTRYWLDGTRTGEGRLLTDADVAFRWSRSASHRAFSRPT